MGETTHLAGNRDRPFEKLLNKENTPPQSAVSSFGLNLGRHGHVRVNLGKGHWSEDGSTWNMGRV